MRSSDEKKALSDRLNRALKRSEKPVAGPSDLALQFNLRYSGEPITPQAAQQWLSGKTIPAPDKIAVLADWLGVSLHWLRFGSPEIAGDIPPVAARPSREKTAPLSEHEYQLLSEFRRLSPSQRQLILDLVGQITLTQMAKPRSK